MAKIRKFYVKRFGEGLPAWAASKIGAALVDAILADQPDLGPSSYTLPSSFGGFRESCEPQYRGKLAAQLRRIHSEWVEREFARMDAQFKLTSVWDQAVSNAIHRIEDADKLIGRVVREAAMHRKAA